MHFEVQCCVTLCANLFGHPAEGLLIERLAAATNMVDRGLATMSVVVWINDVEVALGIPERFLHLDGGGIYAHEKTHVEVDR